MENSLKYAEKFGKYGNLTDCIADNSLAFFLKLTQVSLIKAKLSKPVLTFTTVIR